MNTTRLKIAKLADADEAANLEKALEAVPRVQSVSIDPITNAAIIEHEDASPQELTTAVKKLGYVAVVE